MTTTQPTLKGENMTRGTLKVKENGHITWAKNVKLTDVVERFEKLGTCRVYSRNLDSLEEGQASIYMNVTRFCGGRMKAEFWAK